jgi:hypothetical protein
MLIASANLRPRNGCPPVTKAKLRVFYTPQEAPCQECEASDGALGVPNEIGL